MILPLIAVFLWITMNDREFLGSKGVNSRVQNLIMGAVTLACIALGVRGLIAAVNSALGLLAGG